MSRVFLISGDRATAEAVSAVLSELRGFGEPVVLASAAQTRIEAAREAPDLVLIDEKVEEGNSIVVAREVLSSFPLLPVCMLSATDDVGYLMAAMDAGVRAVLPLPPSVEQYAERLHSIVSWARAVHGQIEQDKVVRSRTVGRVVAVVGSKGGVGTSLVAMMTARVCATQGPTALVDLDLRGGDLAGYCGIRVRHSIVDLAAIAAELGGREVSEVAYPLKGGIELFPAPEQEERSEEMTESATRQIIQALRYQYERIIIDAGSRVDDAMAAALDLADEIVVVATPEVPALRSVRRLRTTMDRLEIGRGTPIRLLLNRSSHKVEIQPAAAAKLAGIELVAAVSDSPARLEPALNTADLLEAQVPALTAAGQAVAALLHPADGGLPLEQPPESPQDPTRGRRARGRRRTPRRSSRGLLRRARQEDGGVLVEFVGGIIIAIGFMFLCLQLLLFGATALFAHNSAQEAARDYSVGRGHAEVVDRVGDRLPAGLENHLSISRSGDDVTVTLGFPGAMPGLGPVQATARIQEER